MEGTRSGPRQNNFYITSAMEIIGVLWLSLLLAAAGASLVGSSCSSEDDDALDYQDLLDNAEHVPRISRRQGQLPPAKTTAARQKQHKRSPEDLKQYLDRGWLALEAPAPVAWTDGRDAPTKEDKRWRREKMGRLRASGKKAERAPDARTTVAPPRATTRPEAAPARVPRELVLPCPVFVPQLVFPQPHPWLQRRWYLL